MFKRMKKSETMQCLVIGLGRFGTSIAKELYANGCEVLAIDSVEEKAFQLNGAVTHVLSADCTDEAVLKTLNIASFDVIIVAIGANMQASIVCSLCCKELGAKYVIAKANDDKHAKILNKIGIDKIIIPEADSALKTAAMLLNPYVNTLMENKDGYTIVSVPVPSEWEGKKLVELDVRNKYLINVLLISRQSGSETPTALTIIEKNDEMIIGGFAKDIKAFVNRIID